MGVTGDDDGDGVVACTNGDRRDKGDTSDVRVRMGGVDGGESGEGNDEPRSSLLGVAGVGALPPCECCKAERLDDGNRGRLKEETGRATT
jgi:hypothetical protein